MVKIPQGKEVGGVIQRLNMTMLGRVKNMGILKRIGGKRTLAWAGVAGLGLYLAASALNSKKQVQGEY